MESLKTTIGLVAFALTTYAYANELPSRESGVAVVKKLFAAHAPQPLEPKSFSEIREDFSERQQRYIDSYLHAREGFLVTRMRIASELGADSSSWWPAEIDSRAVQSALFRDIVRDRSSIPKSVVFSTARTAGRQLIVPLQETFEEYGQDNYSGIGLKRTDVILVSQGQHWRINEIRFQITDPGRSPRAETLSNLLRKAAQTLTKAQQEIAKQKIRIRRATPSRDANTES